VSFGSVYLFVTPLMLAWLRRHSVRNAVMAGFAWAAVSFAATAVLLPANAWMAALLLEAAAFFMIFLDLVAGLPFLMAVKPSERTEMSAVYSTFRDVSHVATPAIGALVLLYFPLGGAFLLLGAMFGMTSALASRLPAELGRKRHRPQPAVGDALAPAGPPALSLSLHAGKVEPTLPE
jgi:hypothetical protein